MKVRTVANVLTGLGVGGALLLNSWLEAIPWDTALLYAGAIFVCLYAAQGDAQAVKVLLIVILAFVSYLKGGTDKEQVLGKTERVQVADQVSVDFDAFKLDVEKKQFVSDVELATALERIREQDAQLKERDDRIKELAGMVDSLRTKTDLPVIEKSSPTLLDADAVRRLNRGRGKRRVR